jgi:hypothetical protein
MWELLRFLWNFSREVTMIRSESDRMDCAVTALKLWDDAVAHVVRNAAAYAIAAVFVFFCLLKIPVR